MMRDPICVVGLVLLKASACRLALRGGFVKGIFEFSPKFDITMKISKQCLFQINKRIFACVAQI